MLMLVFWVVTLCGLRGRYQRFGETHCLHLQNRKVSYVTYLNTNESETRMKQPLIEIEWVHSNLILAFFRYEM
jgi:hypothetical protein